MATPLQNHRVLYVDDHADTVEMVTLMLEAGGLGTVAIECPRRIKGSNSRNF